MSNRQPNLHRLLRRESHYSRATASVIVAVVLILGLVYLAVEVILHLLGQPALLASPARLADRLVWLAESTSSPVLVLTGAVIVVLGVVLLVLGLGPGRRARRTLRSERAAVLVDDAVIASALARSTSRLAGLQPEQVLARVHGDRATVEVRPSSGISVPAAPLQQSLQTEVDSWALDRRLRLNLQIDSKGAVGV